jgi:hypothetical protein
MAHRLVDHQSHHATGLYLFRARGCGGGLSVLVELRLVEQRYQAVLEVVNGGASVIDVARRWGGASDGA